MVAITTHRSVAADPLAVLELAPPRLATLSPDGTRLAWVRDLPPAQALVVGRPDQPLRHQTAVFRPELPVDRLEWLDGRRLLVVGRSPQQTHWQIVDIDSAERRTVLQSPVGNRRGPRLVAVTGNNRLVFSDDRRQPWQPDLYQWQHGAKRRLALNPGGIFRWHAAPDGTVAVARRWSQAEDGPQYEWLWRPGPDRNWRVAHRHRLSQPAARYLGWTADGKLLLAMAHGLSALDIHSGELKAETEISVASAHLTELTFDPEGRLAMAAHDAVIPAQEVFLEPWRSDLSRLRNGMGNSNLRARWLGNSTSGRLWQITSDGLARAFVNVTDDDLQLLGRWPLNEFSAAMRPITVDNPGGPPLPAYLSLPDGSPRGLVLLIHGGPWSRDRWSWQLETQLLVAAGYAVLQVNFRGSGGLGHDWLMAGRRGWGRVILQDLVRSVRWARAGEYHGAGPVCAMGSSFGGYAALMLLAEDDALIDCAVARAPVTDLVAQIRHLGLIGHWRGRAEWVAMVGDPESEADRLAEESPLQHVTALTARPLLLGHGLDDKVVPAAQSRALATALADAGSEPRLIELNGQGHDLRSTPARQRWYREVLAFLNRQDHGPQPASRQ